VGAAQATSAGIGVALAGMVRDLIVGLQGADKNSAHTPDTVAFTWEAVILLAAIAVIWPMVRKRSKRIDVDRSSIKGVEIT